MSPMKLKMPSIFILIFSLAFVAHGLGQVQAEKPDYGKILGTWNLEVNAGGEFYYLVMELKLTEGKLGGGLSELNGMFKDSPLLETAFDGQILKYGVKIPTPPDGTERLTKAEMKLIDNKLEGTITIAEMEITVPVTGIKK